jgi:transglutaminase-like putative cysteine protease
MKYRITHKTWYEYADLAPVCHNLVHLAPRNTTRQSCNRFELTIEPLPAFQANRTDAFGNRVDYFSIERAHHKLEIVAESEVEVRPLDQRIMGKIPCWEDCVVASHDPAMNRPSSSAIEPAHWLLRIPSPRVPPLPALREYAEKSFKPRRSIIEAIVDLKVRIHHDYHFDTRATTVDTPLADVLGMRRGVCQDFAHLAIGCLRSMGLATRYVSGYLRTSPPPGKARLIGADASHAWCSCWCGALGWIDFDPTNNCFAGDSYVTIAWGRDYADVCPIQGVFVGAGEHRIGVSVDVASQAVA